MKDSLEYMLKKVISYWVMVVITLGALVYFIFPKYVVAFILGLFIALSNFIINTVIIKFILLKANGKYGFIASVSFTLRVLVICIIGLVLFIYNKFNVLAYMGGFCSYFICLVLYGINTDN